MSEANHLLPGGIEEVLYDFRPDQKGGELSLCSPLISNPRPKQHKIKPASLDFLNAFLHHVLYGTNGMVTIEL